MKSSPLHGLVLGLLCSGAAVAASGTPYAAADRIFEEYRLDAHLPGLVYGIVADGRLVHVGTLGVQDTGSNRPVTADTLFRVASMTKAFTALTVLKLRDDGRLRLDAPVSEYVPEMKDWDYPTDDSPTIRVRDLLNHAGGFVTDDPWGDRQTPLPEAGFTKLLAGGVPFTTVPGTRFEYSNLGYAILGRIITNVSGTPYSDTITRTLLQPLGMDASGFDAEAAPRERRALGYRWEDDTWRLEPTLGPGTFGAMGGLQTSANDYAKWVTFLLSAWPPRDGADDGPVRRATVRELAQGSNYPRMRDRPARTGTAASRQPIAYGMGMIVAIDDALGLTISHSGGYPGYGSHVLLMPDRGIGIFAMANRTYAGPARAVWDAAIALDAAGLLGEEREMAVSEPLASAYRAAAAIYRAGAIDPAREQLAMNFLLDRDAEHWSRDLARLKSEVGSCDTGVPIAATGAHTGDFTWRCDHGRLDGSLILAPTQPPAIQELQFSPIKP
jgi:D-alanyl-D-alanine-carboxypeptidase/D-alanyl-D-alanine-endopeptidase